MGRCSVRQSFLLRIFSEQNDDRLLLVNFGRRQVSGTRAGTTARAAFWVRMGIALVKRVTAL